MYDKKMLRMWAKRFLSIQKTEGHDAAREWEKRMFKGDKELYAQLVPVVQELMTKGTNT